MALDGRLDPGGTDPLSSYDRWLTWKHGAQLRDRALRSKLGKSDPIDPDSLDWGDQSALTESLALVAPKATELIDFFYTDLFRRLPSVRKLFPSDMSTQHDRLLTALLALVEKGPELAPVLTQLGRDHRKFSVREIHYDVVGQALITTLATFAGPHWTTEVEQAWLARYTAAMTVMTTAAADDEGPPFWYATVLDRRVFGEGVAILRLRPHRPYSYQVGQYTTVESPKLPRVWRPYSMATPPRADQILELHVRAQHRGGLSDVLVNAEPGDQVRLGPPQGTVTLFDSAHPRLFVAGGTGWSMIRALLSAQAAQTPRPTTLLASFRPGEPYDPTFREILRAVPAISAHVIHDPGQLSGVLAPDTLPPDLDAYVAGPPGLVDSTIRLLTTAGISAPSIQHD